MFCFVAGSARKQYEHLIFVKNYAKGTFLQFPLNTRPIFLVEQSCEY